MFIDFIHRLLKPLARWHAEHRAEIIADWLADNDPQMTEAVALLRESRSARLHRSPSPTDLDLDLTGEHHEHLSDHS